MNWTFGYATKKGSIHGDSIGCQDYVLADACVGDYFIGILADGAGSSAHGAIGAEVCCQSMLESIRWSHIETGSIGRSSLIGAFGVAVLAVEQKARDLQVETSELSSTLIVVCIGLGESFFLQIGDGASVIKINNEYVVPLWPAETEFVNTTHFVTSSNSKELVQVRRIAGRIDELFLFSDGLQYLVLEMKTKLPHEKFFRSVSEELSIDEGGRSPLFDAWLAAMLSAPQVTQRSDDDTAILFARRTIEIP